MKTSTKAILISIAIAMLPIALLLAYLYLYIPAQYTPEKLQAKGEEGFLLGQQFGKTTNEQGCFVEASVRAGNRSLNAINVRPWLSGCLSASETTPGFCDGIPPPSDTPDLARQKAMCAKWSLKDYCLYLMPAVEAYCHQE